MATAPQSVDEASNLTPDSPPTTEHQPIPHHISGQHRLSTLVHSILTRSVGRRSAAQQAHQMNDPELSRQIHQRRRSNEDTNGSEVMTRVHSPNEEMEMSGQSSVDIKIDMQRRVRGGSRASSSRMAAYERHNTGMGQYIKPIVFGGVDGIITTFAIVSGTTGASLSTAVVLILGLCNLIADGISMGVGDWLSSRAEIHYAISERQREEWETEHYLEGEKEEMVEIYEQKGLSREDARTVIDVLSKYKDVFVDAMLVDELGIHPPDLSTAPWKSGLVTFLSFCCFGAVPLISYVVTYAISPNGTTGYVNVAFIVACILTAMTLFILGSCKSRLTTQHWFRAGLEVLVTGVTAAALAYLIAWGLEKLVDVQGQMTK